MKLNGFIKKIVPVLVCSVVLLTMAYGCFPEPGSDGTYIPPAGTDAPAQVGPYTKCTYVDGLEDPDYLDAIVYYPCKTNGAPFPASTLTGGWTNVKEQMDWMGSHLVTHGYIIIAMTPNNNWGNNTEWRKAHNAGIAMLKSENSRSGSKIYGLVNTNALQIMGYSKGGGGTLLAAHDQGNNIKSAQALAPYIDAPTYNISGIRANTILYTGTEDTVAPPDRVVGMYGAVPASVNKTLAYFNGMDHLIWWNSGDDAEQAKILTYMVSWMKVYLNGDTSYAGYLDGHQNWFHQFEHKDAPGYSGSSSSSSSGSTSGGASSSGGGCGF